MTRRFTFWRTCERLARGRSPVRSPDDRRECVIAPPRTSTKSPVQGPRARPLSLGLYSTADGFAIIRAPTCPTTRTISTDLAEFLHRERERVLPFIGAGVSVSAGVPSAADLAGLIAIRAGPRGPESWHAGRPS
jgi:hypothetical protein